MTIDTPLPATMKAIMARGKYNLKLEDVPVPQIEMPTDVILKTRVSGLCDPTQGYIIGHEVVGEVVRIGDAIKNFKVGDIVAAPFASNCGACFYCDKGYTARCAQSEGYGCEALNGCQAEYVRQPLADSSLFPVPEGMSEEAMLLLGDILPTAYSCAYHGRRLLDEDDDREMNTPIDAVAVVLGCGPVGLCCVSSAKSMFKTVYATDPSEERRAQAAKHGAIALPLEELQATLSKTTDGRGADVVLELVGNTPALHTALELVRPFGAVSSIGMHMKPLELHGEALYAKNARLQFGRCSVRRFFPGALRVLQQNRELFDAFIQHRIRFDQFAEYYELFDKGKIGKTVFYADDVPIPGA
ncbi:hypothetical protein A1Q1_05464 [Trichosporon asahii var. asahii CBS 2479]|uniref:Enoyl reductase (ER) domain-containing protein n=1 Tax=Trichosporon asahii var. asahii (strain ATCC 90039 / CBS 2479 / JCM 2466 / KCTC 7840 / NBRC 103889/ NCYC 2677 / UAMH 7654) TaxID=1186058 RepID=J6F5E1_TRIAS|nr:hypothetical protein A1Q1_05464 [Trichosporon asahii var. asahii CBS 2479]EJT52254.1 hypothetical protein A1Q1_05464 [Trichosporon asahii var. asahii CBS 2479]